MTESCPDTLEDPDLNIFFKMLLNLKIFLNQYLVPIASRCRDSKSYYSCSCPKAMGNFLFPFHAFFLPSFPLEFFISSHPGDSISQ